MSNAKDLTQLAARIAARHGWPAAKAFKSYEMNEADQAVLSKCAVDLLKVFPAVPDASMAMSAALAVSLESRMDAPIHVVTGTLSIEGKPVLGSAESALPSAADTAGYAWVMVGPHVVDISIFRTAYSRQGPAILSRHVDLMFGPGKGLYVDLWKRTPKLGLRYDPHFVLSAEQVTDAMGEAYRLIKQSTADRS